MKNFYALVFCMFVVLNLNGQTVINLNDTSGPFPDELVGAQRQANSWFNDGVRVRPFHLNPKISNHQNLQDGNQIILQLFDDASHPATVLRKFTDINGVTTLTLKLNAYQYAYAYIALSPDSYLVTVDIPEENEKYSSRSGINQPQAYMFQLDETEFQNLKCGVDDEVHSHKGEERQTPQVPKGNTPLPGVPVDGNGPSTLNTGCHTMPNINDPATIRLLLPYTPAAESWANSNQGGISNVIGLTLAHANQVSVNNNLGINFQLAHSPLVNYTEVTMGTDWVNLQTDGNGHMDEVHDLRKVHNADLVALLNYNTSGGATGIANLLDTKYGNNRSVFSATKINYAANSNTFIHEIGHNLGAMHNLYQASAPGPTVWENWTANTWTAGWRWQGSDNNYYADLMSYGGSVEYSDGFHTSTIPYFSDPTFTHLGAAAGHPSLADNARTLREIKHYVARYKETIVYCGGGNAPMYNVTSLYINNVTMGDIINPSGPSSIRYGDFTALATCIIQGNSQTLDISVSNSTFYAPVKVWIDWNDDKIFDPLTEMVYDSGTGAAQHTVTITAPLGVAIGDKRMRIRVYSSTLPPVVDTPCGYSSVGEVEDYTIKLEAAPVCTVANVPQNVKLDDATSNTATLSWDSQIGIDNYEFRFREIGASVWTEISPIWYHYHTLSNLNFNTDYEVEVRSVCNGSPSTYSSSFLFTTTGYCQASYGGGLTITRVRVADIDQTSSGGSGYSDFTAADTDLERGRTYNIKINNNSGGIYELAYAAYIDYNYNGTFDLPAELVWNQTAVLSSEVSGQFTVPIDASLESARLRILMIYTTNITSIPQPCVIAGSSGEVEDYIVNIIPYAPCTVAAVPVNLTPANLTESQVTLNWDEVTGADYDLRYRETGATVWIEVIGFFENTLTIQSLNFNTQYEAQVRSVCDSTPGSYSPSVIFTTESYCYSQGGSNRNITNVNFSDINNNSSAGNPSDTYTDFTGITASVIQSLSYNIGVTGNGIPTDNRSFRAWIDFNQNGIFEASEMVLDEQTTTFTVTESVTVPADALLGNTRMRISYKYPSATQGPCDTFDFGEVEDYTVFIAPSGYYFQNGNWSPEDPAGVSTLNDDIYIINGTTLLTGNLQADNIYISAGATLSTVHAITLDGDIDNDGVLLFNSNASSTGQLDTFAGNITGSGVVTIERYIPSRRAFRFLSSAVTTTSSINSNWQEGQNNTGNSFPGDNQNNTPGYGTHITGSQSGINGFDASPGGNPSIFTLNNTGQTWEALTNTDVNTIDPGKAYRIMVRGDRSINVTSNSALSTPTTLRTTGILHTGTFVATDLSNVENAFNFFGNPYPAAVDMIDVIAASTNVNPSFYYIWNPNMGTRGAYVTVELPQGTNTSGLPGNQYLQPGQAAFVSTLANGATNLQFEEVHKNVAAPLTAVFNINSRIDIRLYRADAFIAVNPASDGLRLKFSEDQTNAITSMDAPKFFNQDENLASSNDDRQWSIENRALPLPGESIPLFTNQYRTTDYVFEVDLIELNAINALLKDNFTGSTTELDNNQNTLYAFTVNPEIPESIAANRFEIVFEKMLSTVDISFGTGFVLYPNPTEGGFTIVTRGISSDNVMVSIANVLGQILYDQEHTVNVGGQLFIDVNTLTQGVYIVKLTHSNGGKFTTKLIKK